MTSKKIAITAPTSTGKTTLFLENHLNLKMKKGRIFGCNLGKNKK
jgi:hypothetical protein